MNYALIGAAKECNIDIANYAIKNGANNWNRAIVHAVDSKCKELIKFLFNKGATNIEQVIRNIKDEDLKDYMRSLI